jgi:hypothetical protein
MPYDGQYYFISNGAFGDQGTGENVVDVTVIWNLKSGIGLPLQHACNNTVGLRNLEPMPNSRYTNPYIPGIDFFCLRLDNEGSILMAWSHS